MVLMEQHQKGDLAGQVSCSRHSAGFERNSVAFFSTYISLKQLKKQCFAFAQLHKVCSGLIIVVPM